MRGVKCELSDAHLYVLAGAGGNNTVAFALPSLTQVPCHGWHRCHRQEHQQRGQHPHITTTQAGPTGQRYEEGSSNSPVGELDGQSFTVRALADCPTGLPMIPQSSPSVTPTTCPSIGLTLSRYFHSGPLTGRALDNFEAQLGLSTLILSSTEVSLFAALGQLSNRQ